MPTVDLPAGIVVPRRIGEPLSYGVAKVKEQFGFGVTNPANSIREMTEGIGALPWDQREQDMVVLAQQFDPRINSGQFLEASLWPLERRRQPAASAGIVNLNYKTVITSINFAAGDLEFTDGAGVRYTGAADITAPVAIHDTSIQTGTASEAIGGTNTRAAQKIHVLDTDFPQAVRFILLDALTGTPLATVRIESDSAGSPSGVLAHSRLEKTGVSLTDGTNDAVFEKGAKLATGDYWLVVIVSGGTATFDGGIGGVANQVKYYDGTWHNSALVENLDVKVYNGGEFPVVATQLGSLGNIAAGSIGSVRANNGPAQTLFDTNVGMNFENLEAFEGGRDLETDELLRNRARSDSASRGTSSPGGIVFGMLNSGIPGISFVDILENDTMAWGQQETILNNATKTGANSELIDGVTYTKIAERFVVTQYGSVSAIAVKLGANSGAVMTVSIQTESAGSPTGNLAAPGLSKTGVTPSGTTRLLFTLPFGDFLPVGTYWVVAERTAGSFRFDGTTSGATDNVKVFNGTVWTLSTDEDINVEIYGGVPPKSFELFVEGGTDDDVAQGIYAFRAPGILPYGPVSATAMDVSQRPITQRFARPVNVDSVFDVQVQVTSAFMGSADDIRDLVLEYVAELGIGETLVREEAKARLMQGDARTTGIFDIVKFRLGKKTSFPTPGDLTSTEIVNLTLGFGQRHRIIDAAVDMDVQIDVV